MGRDLLFVGEFRMRFTRLLWAVLACLICGTALSGSPIWVRDRTGLQRVDPDAGRVDQAIAIPGVIDLAAGGDGTLWLMSDGTLQHLGVDGHSLSTWSLADLGITRAIQLRADPYDNSVWVSDAKQLVHVGTDGTTQSKIVPAADIQDVALAADESLWIFDSKQLEHYSPAGALIRTLKLRGAAVDDSAHIAVDSLHGLIWLYTPSSVTQLEASTGNVRGSTALDAPVVAGALDPLSGTFWLLTHSDLIGQPFGGPSTRLGLATIGVESAKAVAYDPATKSLWLADVHAVTRVHLLGLDFLRIPLDNEPNQVAAAPLVLLPSIARNTPSPANGTISLALDALCDAASCDATRDYFSSLSIQATLGSAEIGQNFHIDPDLRHATLTIPPGIARNANFFAQATDIFGHQSNVIGEPPGSSAGSLDKKPKVAAATGPTVSITSPTSGAGFLAPANITITATASSSGRTISKIQFYQGSTLIGTVTASPYTITWSNVVTGTYSLTAKATDSANATATSSSVSVSVYTAPTVSITAPANNASYNAPASISITASASDTNATISKVDFYNGSTLLGTKTSSPYTYSWTNVAAGNYSLTAKATNNFGSTTTSSAVAVVVHTPPTVSITSPAANTGFASPANITITASASEVAGTISKVDFYQGSTLIGTSTTSPYSITWSNVGNGTYSLTAKATDTRSVATTSSAIGITVYAPPTVAITAPANNASYAAPASVSITASASDTNATISKVDFYSGSTLLGTKTSSPYTYSWTNVPAGSYTLTAKATNNYGSATTSSPVAVAVRGTPVVSITAPVNNASFNAPASITIAASASEINGTISKVDFYKGSTLLGTSISSPYSFTWNNVGAGSYSLTAKATDANSVSTTSSAINVTVVVPHYPPSVSITAPASGATYSAPATIPISASASETNGTISKVDFYQGSTLIGTNTSSPYGITWNNVAAGSYSLTAVATDTASVQATSSPVTVTVYAPPIVSITSPTAGAVYGASATINFAVNVSGGTGGISHVDFYNGSTLIGTSNASPFGYAWNNVASGSYNITAKATDAQGIVGASTPIYVAVDSTDTCPVQTGQADARRSAVAFGNIPRTFEPNVGQAPLGVAFLSRRGGDEIRLGGGGIELVAALADGSSGPSAGMRLVGSNAAARAVGLGKVEEISNYLLGRDAATWKTGVPHYAQVRFEGIYRGIDEVFYDNGRELEYDFTVAPGADPGQIRIVAKGARHAHIGKHDELVFRSPRGELRQRRPIAYQGAGSTRRMVPARYAVGRNGEIHIRLGVYDKHLPLVIDPVLVYSTYFGVGSLYSAIAVDHCGEAVVVGSSGNGFPTTSGAYSTTPSATHPTGFVSKLNATGTALVYSTFLGGTADESEVYAVSVDSTGHAYVAGRTMSSNFPATPAALNTSKSPSEVNPSAFAAKLSPNGSALLYATYLGGSGGVRQGYVTNADIATSIVADASGNAYLAGYSYSDDMPVTAGAYQAKKATLNAPTLSNAFVAKLNPAGSALLYSTYVGGPSTSSDNNGRIGDFANALAIDSSGNAYVGGETTSQQFPTTAGVYRSSYSDGQPNYSNSGDTPFLFKLNSTGTGLVYSTYFRGSSLKGLAIDTSGAAYISGDTAAPAPVAGKVYVFDSSNSNYSDAYVAKLSADGSNVVYWTVMGGLDCSTGTCYTTSSIGNAVGIDASGNAVIAGTTNAPSFPWLRQLQSFVPGTDGFVAKVNATGNALRFSTPLSSTTGSPPYTYINGLALGPDGTTYTTGATGTSNFPITPGAYQTTTNSAGQNGFVLKLSDLRDTSTALAADQTSTLVTQQVTLTATISGHAPGGTVSFMDGSTSLGSASVSSGTATLTYSGWAGGAHTLTATYSGDANNDPSTSSSVSLSVGDPFSSPTVTITSPTDGTTYVNQGSGYTPQVWVQAAGAAGNNLASVDLYQDNRDIGYVTPSGSTLNYTFTGSTYSNGTHVYWATARDVYGNVARSAPVRFTVNSSSNAPTVTMTAPADNSSAQTGALIGLGATATPPSGSTIQFLQFYQDGQSVGQINAASGSTTSPNPLQSGNHIFYALAYDNNGNSGMSPFVHVNVAAAAAPKVYLYNPSTNWTTYYTPAQITLSAVAEGINGSTVSKVDFYSNGTLIGTVSSAPFTLNWTAPAISQASQNIALTAVVTDSAGAKMTSNTVNETLASPNPSVVITSPSSGTSVTASSAVSISASASAVNSATVSKVDFYLGSTLLGTATAAPYSISWNAGPPGSYALTANVTDSNGRTAPSAPVYLEVASSTSGALGVTITSPSNYSSMSYPQQLNITASAYAGSGASVSKVEFYSEDDLIGTAYSLPYNLAWAVPAPGGYSITAKVTDSNGATATSTAVNFVVDVTGPLSLQVTNVQNGAAIADDHAVISGTVNAPANSSVTIDGRVATLAPNGTFFLNDVQLQSSATSIPVVVTDSMGNTSSTSITLSSSGVAPFRFSASPTEGVGALQVEFFLHNNGTDFTEIDVSCFGDGSVGFRLQALPPGGDLGSCGYSQPGVYTPAVTVLYAPDGASPQVVYYSTLNVYVRSPHDQDAQLKGVVIGALARLQANDVSGALAYFSSSAQDNYSQVFTNLGSGLPTYASSLGTPAGGLFNNDIAEYSFVRSNDQNGDPATNVYLIRDGDGIWRIEGL